MPKLPFKLPAVDSPLPGQTTPTTVVNPGSYDVLIGGHGFRLATDQQFPYTRTTEPTTTHRYDSSLEPGEQSLSPLPWIKSQSSFHAGAGQLNLEAPFTAFQYQQEQVEHVRYDISQNVDPWTPGVVKRLPDVAQYDFGFTILCSCAGNGIETDDTLIVGGEGVLHQITWPDGIDSPPTVMAIDLSGAPYNGAANCTVNALATDGRYYYATLTQNTAPGRTYVVKGSLDSAAAPAVVYNFGFASNATVLGWVKERLMLGVDNKVYELSTTAVNAALPTPKYTHPNSFWEWNAISESPVAILAAGTNWTQDSIIQFTLDSSGNTPTLSGGATIAVLPPGERIFALENYLGTFLVIGTSAGVRVGTFDTYTGAMTYGPLSLVTTEPVRCLVGRDRFVYADYTDQQPDGTTGLVALDLSMQVDTAGRVAWAPSLKPPTSAPNGVGTVLTVSLLPNSERLVFITDVDGIHVEGDGPGQDGDAWLRTSRIRYGTDELKLFKMGRVHGTLDTSTIEVVGSAPWHSDQTLATVGFATGGDPGPFRLMPGLNAWTQLTFHLQGSTSELNSYQVTALPAPSRQRVTTMTLLCFRQESDKTGKTVIDPEIPWVRYQNLRDLEGSGEEIAFVEFGTLSGTRSEQVVIDQLSFRTTSRPTIKDDIAGYIDVKLRATET